LVIPALDGAHAPGSDVEVAGAAGEEGNWERERVREREREQELDLELKEAELENLGSIGCAAVFLVALGRPAAAAESCADRDSLSA
jgi:hypothetical protein